MRNSLVALALAAASSVVALPAAAQAVAPPLPALTAEQSDNLNRELTPYRQEVDERVAHGEITPDQAQRLLEWRRWQLARQIAGLAPPEAPMVAQQQYGYPQPYGYPQQYAYPPQYVYPPPAPAYAYDPWYRPYYYGPRISVCAGGAGHHGFASFCF